MKASKASMQRRQKTKIKLPVWDFYRDGVTSSLLRKFLTCREQFYLEYVEGWRKTGLNEPIEFGNIFHDALAAISEGKDPIRRVTAHAKKRNADLTAGDQNTINRLAAVVKVMLPLYIDYWNKHDRNFIQKWVEHESVFDVQFPMSLPHTKFDFRMRGRRDGVFESGKGKDKALWLFETKTKSVIPEQTLLNVLPFDTQVMLYCFALSVQYDLPVRGVCYNVIRRPGLRIRKNDTLKEYVDRVAADVKTRPEWYFMRWHLNFDANEIDKWAELKLRHITFQMIDWFDDLKQSTNNFANPEGRWNSRYHFINDQALHGAYGPCDTFDAITRDNFIGLKQTQTVFTELED